MDEPCTASIDCNSLQLSIGHEIYVTPNLAEVNTQTKKQLRENEPFVIPPGQFAFLLTQEIVSVPSDAMALISIKATFKMKGLVNVSGFHVDPGWRGRLIFAVFNAGPQPVHLERGLRLFLIWYASLDADSDKRKTTPGLLSISPATINNLTGGSDSFFELNKKIDSEVKLLKEKNEALSERIHKLDISLVRYTVGCAALVAALIGLGARFWPIQQVPLSNIKQAVHDLEKEDATLYSNVLPSSESSKSKPILKTENVMVLGVPAKTLP